MKSSSSLTFTPPLFPSLSSQTIATFTVHPELVGEFKEWLTGENGVKVTRGYKGAREITVCWGAEEGKENVVTIFERWDKKSSFEAYFAWRGETGLGALAEKFFAAPPVFTHCDEMREA